MPATGVQLLDLQTVRDDELLERVYEELYLPSIPLPEEREDLASLKSQLWEQRAGLDEPSVHFFVAGNRLEDAATRAVSGFLASLYYPISHCALLAYAGVARDAQGRGLGRMLLRSTMHALSADARAMDADLEAVFAEVNDPAKVPSHADSMPPSSRLVILARAGAKRVPIPYVQPEIAPGRGRGSRMVLVTLPLSGSRIDVLPTSVVKRFLTELYVSLGVARPSDDPDFSAMMKRLGGESIQLESLA